MFFMCDLGLCSDSRIWYGYFRSREVGNRGGTRCNHTPNPFRLRLLLSICCFMRLTVTLWAKIVFCSCRCRRSRDIQDAVGLLYIVSYVPAFLFSSKIQLLSCQIVRDFSHTNISFKITTSQKSFNPLHISSDMSNPFLANFSISVSQFGVFFGTKYLVLRCV